MVRLLCFFTRVCLTTSSKMNLFSHLIITKVGLTFSTTGLISLRPARVQWTALSAMGLASPVGWTSHSSLSTLAHGQHLLLLEGLHSHACRQPRRRGTPGWWGMAGPVGLALQFTQSLQLSRRYPDKRSGLQGFSQTRDMRTQPLFQLTLSCQRPA